MLRFVGTAPHIFSLWLGEKAARDVSARASPFKNRRRISLKLSCVRSRSSLGAHAPKQDHAYRQARMNSRNPTNIASGFTHRQPRFAASHRQGNSRSDGRCFQLVVPSEVEGGSLARSARDFGRRTPGSPSLRAAGLTPAKRLNLLKGFAASTLEIFRYKTRSPGSNPHGGG